MTVALRPNFYHRQASRSLKRLKMKFNIATVVYATIFATMYFCREAFASDVYCFSCFGYDEDGHTKCHTVETGDLYVRKCTTNTTCIRYHATYEIPQAIGGKLRGVPATVHGLHCGTHNDCDRIECPNFWPKDITHKNCEIDCCHPLEEKCSFPIPSKDDINRFNGRGPGVKGVSAKAGARGSEGSGVTRVSQSVWLPVATFAIFGLFIL